MPQTSSDVDVYKFVEYNVDSICGTMKKILPKGTRIADGIVPPNNDDIILEEAINMFLDAEDDDDEVVEDGMDL